MRPAKGTEMDQGGQKRINYFSKRSSGIEKDQVYFKVIKGGIEINRGGIERDQGAPERIMCFWRSSIEKDRVYFKGIEWD